MVAIKPVTFVFLNSLCLKIDGNTVEISGHLHFSVFGLKEKNLPAKAELHKVLLNRCTSLCYSYFL